VALSSFALGPRASRQRPGATCSAIVSSARTFSSPSTTVAAPSTTTER
jgi:hypothetical protein